MAIREGTRRWLLRCSWAGLIASLSLWLGLWLGRPLYYTDGAQQLRADDLLFDGMLRWSPPEVVAELPGKVSGRVAQLPDGRLCHGRLLADGTSDLVLFDPKRPHLAPEPAYGLNSAHNELAPALGPDGTFYFASDRPGGFGGYDLYTCRFERGGFTPPVPLAAINTARDETDPAPSPDGSTLVFVRIDKEQRGPDDGRLFGFTLGGELDAAPLFDEPSGQRQARRADRDPAFSADGAELWFVRKALGEPPQLLRVSVHQGRWDRARPANTHWGIGAVRAPLPSADGLHLYVLRPGVGDGASDLWYVSTASEVHPFWLGQRWLEWLLLGVALTCLLLLVLLHLGRRWTALDLLVQCLLLSLLLHVLLFLWLMGVEITGALLPGDDAGAGLEVSIVTSSSAAGGAGDDGQVQQDLAAMVQFRGREQALAAAAPGTALEPVSAAEALTGPAAELPQTMAAGSAAAAAPLASLQDEAQAAALRDGAAVEQAVDAASLPTVAAAAPAAATTAAERGGASDAAARIVVTAPGANLVAAPLSTAGALAAAAAPPAVPSARAVTVADTEVSDVAAVPAPRTAARDQDASAPLPVVAATLPGPGPQAGPTVAMSMAPAVPRAARTDVASGNDAVVLARPGSALAGPTGSTNSAPAATLPPAPAPLARTTLPAPTGLRDGAAPAAAAPQPAAGRQAAALPVASAALPVLQAGSNDAAVVPQAAPRHAVREAVTAPLAPSLLAAAASARREPQHVPPMVSSPRGGLAPQRSLTALRDAATPLRGSAKNATAAADSSAAATARAAELGALPALAGPAPAALTDPHHGAAARPGLTAAAPPTPPGSLWSRTPLQPLLVAAELREHNAYSNRFGPAKAAAIEQFGGTADTERAVRDGLRYLASIQNRDGSWGNRRRFDDKYGLVYVGKSALCLLAFLGAGHTPTSNTEHSQVVERALAHLLALQDADTGAFGVSSCYGHGIATYALAECYGLTKDPALLRPLENALGWLLTHQGPRKDRKNRGGWGYFSPGLQAEDSYARISVTAWMVMALESARLSGIELPPEVLPRAREYLELSFDEPNGWFRYNQNPSRLRSQWPTLPASTPAGAFCLLLLGVDKDDPRIVTAVDYTVERRPQRYRKYADDDFVLGGQGNVYFWYYGSLACFLRGGEAWTRWNERLKTVLPAGQAADGSFPPIDTYADYAGDSATDRSYTTAMCVLSLEVYYRYFTPLLVGR